MMKDLLARITSWRSTTVGVVLGGIVYYGFTSFGCTLPTDWKAWALAFAAALPPILARRQQ